MSVVVVGGGPAGLSAALWLQQYGLAPVVVEAKIGGGNQALSPYANVTLLGQVGTTAREVAGRFREHAAFAGVPVVQGRVTKLARAADNDAIVVEVEGRAQPFVAKALVIATGTRFRLLDVPGAADARATGRLRAVAPAPAFEDASGQDVVVIGGGDNAFFLAAHLAPFANQVTIVARSRLRAHRANREPILGDARVDVVPGAEILSIEAKAVRARVGGEERSYDAHLVYEALGYTPNSEDARAAFNLDVDDNGYILVDGNCKTSAPRIWAAGDVANPEHPCTATAIAYGTIAARDIERVLDGAPKPWELDSPAFLLTGERRRRARGT